MGLWTLSPDLERMEYHPLGAMDQGAAPMHVVPANWWQAAKPVQAHSLCTCLVAPGFDFTDFSFMTGSSQQEAIRGKWPELAFLI
jgi:predicted cupin superfamily sugar epimerase